MFLICAIFFWFLFGWLADYSFPFGQALELMLSCFTGNISARINKLQKQLQRTDIVSQPDNKQQIAKLNNLESQAWLYEGILLRLGEDASVDHEKIARTLEALEFKRNEILQELKPRRPKRYRLLAGIQDSARELLASKAEKDYEQLQKIVTNTVLFARDRQPSPIIISEVIEKLATEITQNQNKISPYRLRLAYKVDELIKILSTKLVLGSDSFDTDSDYQLLINELNSRLKVLSKEFNSLLKVKKEDKDELNRRIREISNLTKNIYDLHRDVSNRNADIVALQKNILNLTELSRDKQTQINSLQDSISDLQRDIQNSTEVDQRKQAQINYLREQLSQLNRQKQDIEERMQNIANHAQRKESQVADLISEKSELLSQKSDLERRYQNLYQNHQEQQNEINNLRAKIKNLSQNNRAQPSNPSYQKQQKPFQETRAKITPEQYNKIVNQNDYVYVKAHTRNGSYVKAHYRRRPNR